jgi:hypothetical protein
VDLSAIVIPLLVQKTTREPTIGNGGQLAKAGRVGVGVTGSEVARDEELLRLLKKAGFEMICAGIESLDDARSSPKRYPSLTPYAVRRS